MPDWITLLWVDVTTRVAVIGAVAVVAGASVTSFLLIVNSRIEHYFESKSTLQTDRRKVYARVLHSIRNYHPNLYVGLPAGHPKLDERSQLEMAINESISEAALLTENYKLRKKLTGAARACGSGDRWQEEYGMDRGEGLLNLEQAMREEIGIPLFKQNLSRTIGKIIAAPFVSLKKAYDSWP